VVKVAGFLPVAGTVVLWFAAMIPIENTWVFLTYRNAAASIPINVEHMSERYGLFVMLMLGESVINIVTDTKIEDVSDFFIIFLGFTIVFSQKMIYYGAQPHNPDHHALRISANTGRTFIYSHLFLSASLVGVGTGIKLLKKSHQKGKQVSKADYQLFTYSLVLFLVTANVLRLAHGFKKRSPTIWIFRVAAISIIALFPVIEPQLAAVKIIATYAVLCVVLSFIDAVASDVQVREKSPVLNNEPKPPKDMKMSALKSTPKDLQPQSASRTLSAKTSKMDQTTSRSDQKQVSANFDALIEMPSKTRRKASQSAPPPPPSAYLLKRHKSAQHLYDTCNL